VTEAALSPADERTSLLGGSALLFWTQVATAAGLLVAVLQLARGLGPDGRGTMAFISVAALVIGRVARMGVGEATGILAAQRPTSRAALLADLALFVVPATFVVASAVAIGLLLMPEPRPAGVGPFELLAMVPAAMGIALVESCVVFLLGCRRFVARAITGASQPWLYAALLAVLTASVGLTVARAAFAWALAMSLSGLFAFAWTIRTAGLGRPDRALLLEAIRFGTRLWVGTLSSFLNMRADQLLMGFITTKATLGLYAVAVNAAEVLLYFPSAIGEALFPFLAAGRPGERAKQALRVVRLLILSTSVSIVVAAIVGSLLIPVVFGAAFAPSVVVFLWLLPGTLGFAAIRVFSSALATSSAPGHFSVPPLVSLVVGLVLDLLLIPGLGATGAAIAASAGYIAGGATALLLHRSRDPFAAHELVPRLAEVRILVPRARAAFSHLRSLL
jgi:O-antigen/teichoic acid export membrane protein